MSNASPRRLTLIRHAKAEQDNGMLPDALRALNMRGQGDALLLGEWLHENNAYPELFLCSTAQRTRQTLAAFGSATPVKFYESLYLASARDILKIVSAVDDVMQHIAIIGHNPGLHQLAAMLVRDYTHAEDEERLALKFPTSATAIFSLNIGQWRDLVPHTATLEAFFTLDH